MRSKVDRIESATWKDYFTYDASAGWLIWKRRPISHFRNRHVQRIFNSSYSKKRAGCKQFLKNGLPHQVRINIAGNFYGAHRIIWELKNGPIPEGMEIDHKDCNPHNNRLSNLRVCTHAENGRNKKIGQVNTSGFKNVSWSKRSSKWRSYVTTGYKQIHLGYFDTKYDLL